MNIDEILKTFNNRDAEYILIGGMNFMIRHLPVLTFDVDLWVKDSPDNRLRCERALVKLDAEWGATDNDWRPVKEYRPGWLERQCVFFLSTPHGAVDVFRNVMGLESWQDCQTRAVSCKTAAGVAFMALSDEDMLACQYA